MRDSFDIALVVACLVAAGYVIGRESRMRRRRSDAPGATAAKACETTRTEGES